VAVGSRTITFNLPVQSVINVTVYQINGTITTFLKKSIPCGTTVITLPHFATGFHLIRISINEAVVMVKKSMNNLYHSHL
jgi:hypothetical protein